MGNETEVQNIEFCPKCKSKFIEYKPAREEICCLIRNCQHHYKIEYQNIKKMLPNIQNINLRATIPRSDEEFTNMKRHAVLEQIAYNEH